MGPARSAALAAAALVSATAVAAMALEGSGGGQAAPRSSVSPDARPVGPATTDGRPGPPAASPAAPSSPAPAARWERRAEAAQETLEREYANRDAAQGWIGQYRLRAPAGIGDRLLLKYWWQAHALDVLVDRQERDPTAAGLERIRALVAGVRATTGEALTNDYYDDMAWMGLALLRADAVGANTAPAARALWDVLREAWSSSQGGGIPWRVDQPDYKNVPANGPAAILAARLYRRDGRPEDLEWARRIVGWMHDTLVDPQTGVVWDGVNRRGDGRIDRDWIFTYTHGVTLGADLELHAITGDPALLARARRTAGAAIDRLAPGGVLRDEGPGDGALFKGILARCEPVRPWRGCGCCAPT